MKTNVTIVLDEDAARWLRIEAARRDTSVSRFVGELVERERERDEGYGDAMRRFMGRSARPLGPPGEPLPSRDEVHRR